MSNDAKGYCEKHGAAYLVSKGCEDCTAPDSRSPNSEWLRGWNLRDYLKCQTNIMAGVYDMGDHDVAVLKIKMRPAKHGCIDFNAMVRSQDRGVVHVNKVLQKGVDRYQVRTLVREAALNA